MNNHLENSVHQEIVNILLNYCKRFLLLLMIAFSTRYLFYLFYYLLFTLLLLCFRFYYCLNIIIS